MYDDFELQKFKKKMPKLSKFKVVLVGDQNVGKTSIISRFIHDSFDQASNPTVGIDFITKTMQVDGETLRLQLWDTAGQERFRSLIPSYVRDADCCLIVIDLTTGSSLEGVDKWLDFVRETRGQDGLIFLVGNKVDLNRQVPKSEGQTIAQKHGINYIEVSAKQSTNINLLFRKVAQNLIQTKRSAQQGEQQQKETLSQDAQKSKETKPPSNNIKLSKQNNDSAGDHPNGCKC